MRTIFKIRQKGTKSYSHGRVDQQYVLRAGTTAETVYGVKWSSKGKEWASEKAIKQHLLKCIQNDINIGNWEIMEFTQQPSRSLNEWCDAKMTMELLKHVR